MDERYQKFITSKQEQLRLRIALEDFFREETGDTARDGQEIILFVSALTRMKQAMDFICLHGCAPYLEHSRKLLYREREEELLAACGSVLEDQK